MTPSFDVWNRLAQLRQNIPGLRLYGLLDGGQYLAQSGQRFVGQAGMCALFAGTTDADLAFAGPWLIDIEKISNDLVALVDKRGEHSHRHEKFIWIFQHQGSHFGLLKKKRTHSDPFSGTAVSTNEGKRGAKAPPVPNDR